MSAADSTEGLGTVYVAMGSQGTASEPSFLLVKIDESSSYLPAWFTKDGILQFLKEKNLEGYASPIVLTRAGYESSKKNAENLGQLLFLKLEG